jgi:beta-xylosidase
LVQQVQLLVALDVSKMKEGDFAGLSALQKEYGLVGVKVEEGKKSMVMVNTTKDKAVEIQRIPLDQNQVYFRIDCDFTNKKDEANFFYSLDGKVWNPIGETLKMKLYASAFYGISFWLVQLCDKKYRRIC